MLHVFFLWKSSRKRRCKETRPYSFSDLWFVCPGLKDGGTCWALVVPTWRGSRMLMPRSLSSVAYAECYDLRIIDWTWRSPGKGLGKPFWGPHSWGQWAEPRAGSPVTWVLVPTLSPFTWLNHLLWNLLLPAHRSDYGHLFSTQWSVTSCQWENWQMPQIKAFFCPRKQITKHAFLFLFHPPAHPASHTHCHFTLTRHPGLAWQVISQPQWGLQWAKHIWVLHGVSRGAWGQENISNTDPGFKIFIFYSSWVFLCLIKTTTITTTTLHWTMIYLDYWILWLLLIFAPEVSHLPDPSPGPDSRQGLGNEDHRLTVRAGRPLEMAIL